APARNSDSALMMWRRNAMSPPGQAGGTRSHEIAAKTRPPDPTKCRGPPRILDASGHGLTPPLRSRADRPWTELCRARGIMNLSLPEGRDRGALTFSAETGIHVQPSPVA